MSADLFDDDDDLFAPRPAPAPPAAELPPRKTRRSAVPEVSKPPLAWVDNAGQRPKLKAGARIVVELWSGRIAGNAPVNTDSKLGWDPETTRWSFMPDASPLRPFDVRRYRVL